MTEKINFGGEEKLAQAREEYYTAIRNTIELVKTTIDKPF